MKLYIDLNNLESIVKSKDSDIFDEFVLLVKRDLDVHYNFDKKEILTNKYVDYWFKRIRGQGKTTKDEILPEFQICPDRPINDDFYNHPAHNASCSIFMLSEEEICNKCLCNGVLAVKIGQETDLLREILSLKVKETPIIDIKKWSEYCPKLPLTQLIFVDPFYFADLEEFYKDDYEIFKELSHKSGGNPISIVIFTEKVSQSIKLGDVYTELKREVIKITGNKECTVSIFVTMKRHARCVITNYYRIKSESGFRLKEYRKKDDNMADIKPHYVKQNEKNTRSLMVQLLEIATNNDTKHFGDPLPTLIYSEDEGNNKIN